MGDGFGHTDKDVISNTDAVSASEQQADGSDTSSSSEPGNGEVGSSVSGSAAIASVVEGTHNAPQDADLINNRQPSDEREGDQLHQTPGQENTSQFPHERDSNIETALSSNRRCRSPDDEFSCPPKKPRLESSLGSASGQESSEVGSSSSGSAVEGSRGPSVVEGFLQASLNDNQHNCSRRVENGSDRSTEHYGGAQTMPPPPPPPPARENDVEGQEDIAGQGGQEDPQPEIINIFRRDDLEYGDQGMPPPLHENGNGVQDAVEQDDPDDQEQEIVYEFRHEAEIVFNRNLEHDWEVLELPQAGPEDLQGQGDLVEGPIPEIFNIPENEDGIFIEEDAPILLPENEFVHLPDRFNFQI